MKQTFVKLFTAASAAIALSATVSAAPVEVNGAFEGTGEYPDNWNANKPNLWDPEGSIKVAVVPDIEKKSVLLTSAKKKMHLYTRKAIPVKKGSTVEIKGMVKGSGKGNFGVYFYPMGSFQAKGFTASDDWTEFSAKMDVTSEKVKEVRVVLAADPGAKIEFLGVTVDVSDKTPAAK